MALIIGDDARCVTGASCFGVMMMRMGCVGGGGGNNVLSLAFCNVLCFSIVSGYTLLVSHHVGVVMDACCCMVLHDACMGMVVLDGAASGIIIP